MKIKFFFYIFFILICGCSSDDDGFKTHGESGLDHTTSKRAWQDLKKQNGDSYRYTTVYVSVFGSGGSTILTIANDEVVKREFEAYSIDSTGMKNITASWIETRDQLNIHAEEGAPTLTIDGLYDSCLKDYLQVNSKNNSIYFDTFENAIISYCGFVPDGCQDDCFTGFKISSFTWEAAN